VQNCTLSPLLCGGKTVINKIVEDVFGQPVGVG
jgi:hypothetical protein